jgi:hypothetical protein
MLALFRREKPAAFAAGAGLTALVLGSAAWLTRPPEARLLVLVAVIAPMALMMRTIARRT